MYQRASLLDLAENSSNLFSPPFYLVPLQLDWLDSHT